jgi:hypothetical protein
MAHAMAHAMTNRVISFTQWTTLIFLGWYRFSAALPSFLLILLSLVNLALFYEFLRTESLMEQAKRGAMLVLWYGAILLWVYDPLFMGIVVIVGVICGVVVMIVYKMRGLPVDDSERGG